MIHLSGSLSESPICWFTIDPAEYVFAALVGHPEVETREHAAASAPAWRFDERNI